jgi:hypothetical protein
VLVEEGRWVGKSNRERGWSCARSQVTREPRERERATAIIEATCVNPEFRSLTFLLSSELVLGQPRQQETNPRGAPTGNRSRERTRTRWWGKRRQGRGPWSHYWWGKVPAWCPAVSTVLLLCAVGPVDPLLTYVEM